MTLPLTDIVRDPQLVQNLSPEEALSMATQAAQIVVRLAERARAEEPVDDEMLTTTEAARLLGISPVTLRERIRAGHYKAEVRDAGIKDYRLSKRALVARLRKPLRRA